jgi:Uncharacterised nucleotidyltransferase
VTYPTAQLFNLAAGRPLAPEPGLVPAVLEHRLGGLLWSRFEAGDIELVGDDRRALAATDLQTQHRQQKLWSGLRSAQEALATIGVVPVTFKGVTAEQRWWARLGERPCVDLDLLLLADDLPRVAAVLEVLAPARNDRDMIVSLVERRLVQHVDLVWDGIPIDLHFDFLKLGVWTKSTDLMAQHSAEISTTEGASVRVLAPEMSLVGFATHLNKDRFAYLGSFVDIARILEREELDWDLVERFARAEGLDVPVRKALGVVCSALGVDAEIPLAEPSGWRSQAWDGLWPTKSRLRGHAGRTTRPHRQLAIPLLMRGRASDVFSEMRRQFLPEPSLLDLHRGPSDHSYIRRVTLDRLAMSRARRAATQH